MYSNAQILLLDDILAALDVHTARWVVEKCLKGDLLNDRTVLLVTHNLALTRSVAKKIVHVDGTGHVTEERSIAELVEHDPTLREQLKKEEELVEKAEESEKSETGDKDKDDAKKAAGKLTVAEEVARGHVAWKSMLLYLSSVGGPVFWITRIGLVLVASGFSILQPYWLGKWSTQYETHPSSEVPVAK